MVFLLRLDPLIIPLICMSELMLAEGQFQLTQGSGELPLLFLVVKWRDESSGWKAVGRLLANLTGSVKTVLLGEATDLLNCLRATPNAVSFVTDAQYVFSRARKLRRSALQSPPSLA